MTDKKEHFEGILAQATSVISAGGGKDAVLESLSALMEMEVDYYDWVGFYLVGDTGRDLVLGPFVGEPTEHVHIDFGAGICGQAAERKETFVVQDVAEESNYLSCSPVVRSEIVVPILRDEKVLGEIDIDSHTLRPFDEQDVRLLEGIAALLAEVL